MMPDVPEGSIIITPTEVYNEVRDLNKKVEAFLSSQANSALPSTVADHEQRIRRLERALWIGVGLAAALGSAAGSAASRLLG